jgi:hypothetical protein
MENDLQQEDEYTNRVLVFKVDDNSIYECKTLVKYNLKMFKGTRKEFEKYYLFHVGNLPNKDYMVYDNPVQIDSVEHGHCDRNIIYYNPNKQNQIIKEEKRYLKSGY